MTQTLFSCTTQAVRSISAVEMLCQTLTQLPSESLEENPSQQQSKPPQDETGACRKDYERHKKWVRDHPERAKEHANNWYHRNKEQKREQLKQRARDAYHKRKNSPLEKEKIKARRKKHYLLHGEAIRAKVRAFNTSPAGRAYAADYQRRKRQENPDAHFMNCIRGSVNRILRNGKAPKTGRTMEYIGCTLAELRAHLESQFTEGMTWEIGRGWDVDHIVAVKWFVLTDDEEAKVCCNYKNLQPMWRMSNKYKSATLPTPLPEWLPPHIAARINERAKA